MNNPTWQVCPKCNGDGHLINHVPNIGTDATCNVCGGHGIINILDGRPPSDQKYSISTSAGAQPINEGTKE